MRDNIKSCQHTLSDDVVYKDVVIIGNGPSGMVTSFMLAGNVPYLKQIPDDLPIDEMLRARLQNLPPGQNLLETDLMELAEGLEGRSQNPIPLLIDNLLRPCADLGLQEDSLIEWRYDVEKQIDHIVLGKGPPGGAWPSLPGSVRTLSPAAWLALPPHASAGPRPAARLPARAVAAYCRRYVTACRLQEWDDSDARGSSAACGAAMSRLVSAEREILCVRVRPTRGSQFPLRVRARGAGVRRRRPPQRAGRARAARALSLPRALPLARAGADSRRARAAGRRARAPPARGERGRKRRHGTGGGVGGERRGRRATRARRAPARRARAPRPARRARQAGARRLPGLRARLQDDARRSRRQPPLLHPLPRSHNNGNNPHNPKGTLSETKRRHRRRNDRIKKSQTGQFGYTRDS